MKASITDKQSLDLTNHIQHFFWVNVFPKLEPEIALNWKNQSMDPEQDQNPRFYFYFYISKKDH